MDLKKKETLDAFSFPQKQPLTKNIKDILDDVVDSRYYYNDKPLYPRIKDCILNDCSVYQWRRQYVRENKSGVCPTLTANMGTGGHNVLIILDKNGIRKLTPRECLRLQGFPDSYILSNVSDSVLYKQIGNSVTVTVIERIAVEILKALQKG